MDFDRVILLSDSFRTFIDSVRIRSEFLGKLVEVLGIYFEVPGVHFELVGTLCEVLGMLIEVKFDQ